MPADQFREGPDAPRSPRTAPPFIVSAPVRTLPSLRPEAFLFSRNVSHRFGSSAPEPADRFPCDRDRHSGIAARYVDATAQGEFRVLGVTNCREIR